MAFLPRFGGRRPESQRHAYVADYFRSPNMKNEFKRVAALLEVGPEFLLQIGAHCLIHPLRRTAKARDSGSHRRRIASLPRTTRQWSEQAGAKDDKWIGQPDTLAEAPHRHDRWDMSLILLKHHARRALRNGVISPCAILAPNSL